MSLPHREPWRWGREQLETQGELGQIGDAPEVMEKLVASWAEVRKEMIQERRGKTDSKPGSQVSFSLL